MYGDIIKQPDGYCEICNSTVFIYTREGKRCVDFKWTCKHKNPASIKWDANKKWYSTNEEKLICESNQKV